MKATSICLQGFNPAEFLCCMIPDTRDLHLNSPYNITSESNMKFTRIKEMITNKRGSRLSNKFSLSAPEELYGEKYREFAY